MQPGPGCWYKLCEKKLEDSWWQFPLLGTGVTCQLKHLPCWATSQKHSVWPCTSLNLTSACCLGFSSQPQNALSLWICLGLLADAGYHHQIWSAHLAWVLWNCTVPHSAFWFLVPCPLQSSQLWHVKLESTLLFSFSCHYPLFRIILNPNRFTFWTFFACRRCRNKLLRFIFFPHEATGNLGSAFIPELQWKFILSHNTLCS